MKYLIRVGTLVAIAFFLSACNVAPVKPSISQHYSFDKNTLSIKPTRDQSITMIEMFTMLKKRHYHEPMRDQNFGVKVLNSYLNALDAEGFFLTASDKEKYVQEYADDIIRQLSRGDLFPLFYVFDQYKIKRIESTQAAIRALSSESVTETNAPNPAVAAHPFVVQVMAAASHLSSFDRTSLQEKLQADLSHLEKSNSRDVFALVANAFANNFDPLTMYLSERSSEQRFFAEKWDNFGLRLRIGPIYPEIVDVNWNSQAYKAGLRIGDQLVSCRNGKEESSLAGAEIFDALECINHSENFSPVVKVRHAISGKFKEVALERIGYLKQYNVIDSYVQEVEIEGESYNIGILKVPSLYIDFDALRRKDPNYRSAARDVRKHLKVLEKSTDGVVVSLLNNYGGSLKEANQVSGAFVKGTTVQIQHASGRIIREQRLTDPDYSGPVLALVNNVSASGAEIIAAAIKDHNRGLVVGMQTHGSGTIQSFTPLRAGQLRVTESVMYRVNGRTFEGNPIRPDIEFFPSEDSDPVAPFDYKDVAEINSSYPKMELDKEILKNIKFSNDDMRLLTLINKLENLLGDKKQSYSYKQAINEQSAHLATLKKSAELHQSLVNQAKSASLTYETIRELNEKIWERRAARILAATISSI